MWQQVDENYHVKVADFGLSKVSVTGNTLNSKVGSLNWCAPEILLQSMPYTDKADVYRCFWVSLVREWRELGGRYIIIFLFLCVVLAWYCGNCWPMKPRSAVCTHCRLCAPLIRASCPTYLPTVLPLTTPNLFKTAGNLIIIITIKQGNINF